MTSGSCGVYELQRMIATSVKANHGSYRHPSFALKAKIRMIEKTKALLAISSAFYYYIRVSKITGGKMTMEQLLKEIQKLIEKYEKLKKKG